MPVACICKTWYKEEKFVNYLESMMGEENMKMMQETSFNEAVLKQYAQQQRLYLQIANHTKTTFKASIGKLQWFCKCHGIVNKWTFNEILSAPMEETDPFIDDAWLILSQTYNAVETGTFWFSVVVPPKGQTLEQNRSIVGIKIRKEWILCSFFNKCQGTDTVGKSKNVGRHHASTASHIL